MPIRDRIAEFLGDCGAYPMDVFPLTEDELRQRLLEPDPFWTRALKEGITVFPLIDSMAGPHLASSPEP